MLARVKPSFLRADAQLPCLNPVRCVSSRIGENLEQALPSLRELILTSNNIQELVSVAGDVVGCGASKGFCSGGDPQPLDIVVSVSCAGNISPISAPLKASRLITTPHWVVTYLTQQYEQIFSCVIALVYSG